MSFWGFRDYVSVAQRRKQAAREVEKLKKSGNVISPIVIEGRKIAKSVWGIAWCDNLERYSDFENRLPRGRSYVRNGAVINLEITRGRIDALVSGSAIYQVKVEIEVAKPTHWQAICRDCAGSVGSLIELLQGSLSKSVMERVCRKGDGLFPAPPEIKMSCSCPDWADMCKHVSAVLYGIGARLDASPELLFTLRGVNHADLVAHAGSGLPIAAESTRVLADNDVAALFGLDLATPALETPTDPPAPGAKPKRSRARPDASVKPASSRISLSAETLQRQASENPRTRKRAPKQATPSQTAKPPPSRKRAAKSSDKASSAVAARLPDAARQPRVKASVKRATKNAAKNSDKNVSPEPIKRSTGRSKTAKKDQVAKRRKD